MPSLTLHNLSKTYPGGVAAVRGVSLDIPEGAFAVVVGPSGSGKSTVLRLVAGLESPTAGQVLIDNQDVTRAAPHRRDVAMVFQQPTLYPYLSVRDNLAHGLKRHGLDRAAIAERVAEAARLMSVETLLDRRPHQLSGGEAQRVALGRAVARRPALLLLDEPLSSLDAGLRSQLRGELRRLHARLGATTLHVTHDQAESLSLAELLVVIDQGRVRQVGPPLEVYRRPANRFVAALLGDPGMNLWQGRVESGRFTTIDSALATPVPGSVEGSAVLGVRPECLQLGAGPGKPLAAARVIDIEPLGRDALVRLEIGGQTGCARAPLPCPVEPGQTVNLHAPPGDLHLFATDPAGRRLA